MDYSRKGRLERRLEHVAKEERKKCEGKTYELFGISNFFDLVPDFVFPVFTCKEEGNEKKYIQQGDNDSINNFVELNNYPIIPLKDISTNDLTRSTFAVGSKPLFAFQTTEKEYFIGYKEEMDDFLKKFQTDDKILNEEIEDYFSS